MINFYEESIQKLDTILYDKDMLTEPVFAYRERPGQYFCATYHHSKREFLRFGTFGNFKSGDILKCFKESWQPEFLKKIILANKKKKFFRGSEKINFYFTYNGKSLSLVDVWSEKESYITPEDFNELFSLPGYIESSELIYTGLLNNSFIKSNPGVIIRKKDGTKIRL